MICAVTGRNGAGKTAWSVRELLRYQKKGFNIASNVKIAGAQHIGSWHEINHLRDSVVLLDEIVTIASSRADQSLPQEALITLQQLRKNNLAVFWTAPNFNRADLFLREVTFRWVNVSPVPFLTSYRKGLLWPDTHLSIVADGVPTGNTKDGTPTLDSPFYTLFNPRSVGRNYDSEEKLEGFTLDSHPSRCKVCGASISYGRHDPDFHDQAERSNEPESIEKELGIE